MFVVNSRDDNSVQSLNFLAERERQPAALPTDVQRVLESRFAQGAIRKLDYGQKVWSAGDDRKYIYIVRSGCLRMSEILPDGRRAIHEFAFACDVIGLGSDTHDFDVEVVEPTWLYSLSVAQYRRAMADEPAFASAIRGVARRSLKLARVHVTVLSRLAAGERIAHFLLELSEQSRRSGRDPREIRIPMRRVDVADYLGLTPETICRTLMAFRKSGLISMNQADEALLKDIKRLRSLAGGESDPGDLMRRAS